MFPTGSLYPGGRLLRLFGYAGHPVAAGAQLMLVRSEAPFCSSAFS